MKKFSFLLIFVLGLFFTACDSKIDTGVKEVKYDREVCERCKMVISDRNYAVQIVNKTDGKRYYYDDIGCAVLWFKEKSLDWQNSAVIYVTDANSGKWLDASKAHWTYGANTPMDFGFSANESEVVGVDNFDYIHVQEQILKRPVNGQMGHHMGHKMENH